MKLLITVQGVQYEVDVQVLDDSGAPQAASASGGPASGGPASGGPASGGDASGGDASGASGGDAMASFEVRAPIAGSVLDVKVKPGDRLNVEDPLLVLEAMKMESVITTPQAGTVREVLVKPGDTVTADQLLVRF